MPYYTDGSKAKGVGYDECGDPKWICSCSVITENTGITRSVKSNSKKGAKKAAAYLVLCDHFALQNVYGANSKHIFWVYKDDQLNPESLAT